MNIEVVDQYYWLGYAKKSVDESSSRLNDAAGKISTLVAAFWGIYTAAFTIGATFKKLDEPPIIICLLIAPIPLLIFSYIAALWAQMPGMSLEGIDPTAPDDVMAFYNIHTLHKKIKVWIAMIIFFLSGLSLAFALVYANFTHEKLDKKQVIDIFKGDGKILIAGDLPNNTKVYYKITTEKCVIISQSTIVMQDNHFERTIKDMPDKEYVVSVSWKDNTQLLVEHIFRKKFVVPKVSEKKNSK